MREQTRSEVMKQLDAIARAVAAETDPVARTLIASPRLIGMPRPIFVEPPDADDTTHREPSIDEEQPFYEALGRAMAMWQFVETSLVIVQQASDRTPEREQHAIEFHRTREFGKKLNLVTKSLERVEILKSWADQWPNYESKLRRAAVVRHRITHALVYFDPRREAGSRIFLSVNLRNPARWDEFMRGEKHLDRTALLRSAASFNLLHNEVRNFADAMSAEHDRLLREYPSLRP
jgi:hypothetical protein